MSGHLSSNKVVIKCGFSGNYYGTQEATMFHFQSFNAFRPFFITLVPGCSNVIFYSAHHFPLTDFAIECRGVQSLQDEEKNNYPDSAFAFTWTRRDTECPVRLS